MRAPHPHHPSGLSLGRLEKTPPQLPTPAEGFPGGVDGAGGEHGCTMRVSSWPPAVNAHGHAVRSAHSAPSGGSEPDSVSLKRTQAPFQAVSGEEDSRPGRPRSPKAQEQQLAGGRRELSADPVRAADRSALAGCGASPCEFNTRPHFTRRAGKDQGGTHNGFLHLKFRVSSRGLKQGHIGTESLWG